MTSKRSFINIMKEDLRHKVWMLVLSILGNMLAIPVAFFLGSGTAWINYPGLDATEIVRRAFRQANALLNTVDSGVCILACLIAFFGAIIVGLYGFRYVQNKDMVDTWHSIPVKRKTLFAVGWLNGFLIWFVPFLISIIITAIVGEARIAQLRQIVESQQISISGILSTSTYDYSLIEAGSFLKVICGISVAIFVVFMLVYNLVLLTVMLSGNILNTLIMTGVSGVGVMTLYGITYLFKSYYFDTFINSAPSVMEKLTFLSPFVAVYDILAERYESTPGGWITVLVNFLLALMLGGLAFYFYQKRPSELAECGIRNKYVKILIKVPVTIGAGMCGWLFFSLLSHDYTSVAVNTLWGIFGSLLASILAFGVLDIAFQMDFKAFFRHKIMMGVTVFAALLLALTYRFDWMGYDTYLPAESQIKEISIRIPGRDSFSYRGLHFDEMDEMHYKDAKKAHAFLESMVSFYKNGHPAEVVEQGYHTSETVYVKVTLKNGREYYRQYAVFEYDVEPTMAILTSEEYMDLHYMIPEDSVRKFGKVEFEREDAGENDVWEIGYEISKENVLKLIRAYNQDVEENPELMITGGKRVISVVILAAGKEYDYDERRQFAVYEEMRHTRAALREIGAGRFAEAPTTENLHYIELQLGISIKALEADGLRPSDAARARFGVGDTDFIENSSGDKVIATPDSFTPVSGSINYEDKEHWLAADIEKYPSYDDDYVSLRITDQKEMQEILDLASFSSSTQYGWGGAFGGDFAHCVALYSKDSRVQVVSIKKGLLPEKYILRFDEWMNHRDN